MLGGWEVDGTGSGLRYMSGHDISSVKTIVSCSFVHLFQSLSADVSRCFHSNLFLHALKHFTRCGNKNETLSPTISPYGPVLLSLP
jgi:hypothetical protein